MKRLIIVSLLAAICASMSAQDFSLSTNALDYINMGTLNLEASYGVGRHWSVSASGKYNPFSFRDGNVLNRQRLLSLGARYWPWHVYSGWWMSGKAQYQEYNTGGMRSDETFEGDRLGASFSGGWSYMLCKHLNMDFGLGVWAGYEVYTSYACPKCGRITGSGQKFFILPNDLIVSITYVF